MPIQTFFYTIKCDIIDLSSQQNTCIYLVGELDDYIHIVDNHFILNDNPALNDDAPRVLEKHV